MTILLIRTTAGPFRRAGMAFNETAREVDSRALTDEQIQALQSEPMLVVEDEPASPPSPPAPDSGAVNDGPVAQEVTEAQPDDSATGKKGKTKK
ncbi:MAG: HI1506-related protein [Pseudomonadota bacterium]